MSTTLPTTRAEAIRTASPRYNTGKPCKHGHKTDRYTRGGDCVECMAHRNIATRDMIREAFANAGQQEAALRA